jgi:hypothetical protein
MEQNIKRCTTCKIDKSIIEFGKNKRTSDGIHYRCKTCISISNKKTKSRPEYKEIEKDYNKEYHKEYYSNLENRERIKKRVKKYSSIPEKKKMLRKKQNLYYKNRRKNDPDFRFYRMIIGHVRKIENREEFKNRWDDVKDIYNMYGIDYHIDHLIPKFWFKITTPKNIINHLDNLQVIDAKYNLCKQNFWADEVCSEYFKIALPYIKKEYKEII